MEAVTLRGLTLRGYNRTRMAVVETLKTCPEDRKPVRKTIFCMSFRADWVLVWMTGKKKSLVPVMWAQFLRGMMAGLLVTNQ